MSAKLFKFSKEERKVEAVRALEAIQVARPDLYVPTSPDCRVVTHIASSGTPMQVRGCWWMGAVTSEWTGAGWVAHVCGLCMLLRQAGAGAGVLVTPVTPLAP